MCDSTRLYKSGDGEFFNGDYFERGTETGKSWYAGYHWMPRRSFKEALAVIDYLDLPDGARILDVGCAKGFIVRALHELGMKACGCDISRYAIDEAIDCGLMCWLLGRDFDWGDSREFDAAFSKDTLEHCDQADAIDLLYNVARVTKRLMVVVPLGDFGRYRHPEYHNDLSHLLICNEKEWFALFENTGWVVAKWTHHVPGIKDNWFDLCSEGNMVCELTRA